MTFSSKNSHIHVLYTALDSSKIKRCPTTSIMPHVNKVIPRRSKRSQSRLRAFGACSNRSERVFTNGRDRALSELTNGYLTHLSARMSPNYFSNVPTVEEPWWPVFHFRTNNGINNNNNNNKKCLLSEWVRTFIDGTLMSKGLKVMQCCDVVSK